MKARTAIWFLVFVWHSSMAQMVVDAALSNINRLRDLGISFIYTHQPDSALYYLEASYRNAKHYEGDTHVVVGELAHDLGYVHMSGNDFTAAKTMFVEALRIKRLHYVSPHAEIAITLNALGILFETDSDYIQAESFFLEARDQWAGSLGRDHLRYSWVQHNLGRMYSRMGRAQEAVDCLTDALRIKQEHLPSDDPELGHTWLYLSTALLQLGDVPGYEACALRAAEIWKKQKGINDMLYYWSRDNLANMNLALGHYNHSISLGREALEGKLRLYGTELHDDVALSLQVLSNAYTALEQHDSAYIYLMRAKPIYEKLNPGSLELALCLHNLGTNQYQLNHFEASRDFLRQSLDIKKEI
ncbi:MAG TPA: tetratricopeptide repeat protein, partial [Saprospiraceae bacterium]|nr:tetratricopeptide repeat protein [Saprospiraceae bacterium]